MRVFSSGSRMTAFLAFQFLISSLSLAQATQVVEYPIKRVQRSAPDSVVPTTIYNEQWIYTVEIAIGNPPQKTLVQVDTGSAYLWVNANCSSAPTAFDQQKLCQSVPRYDPGASSSVEGPIGSRTLGYGSGEEVIGAIVDIYEDAVTVGNAKINTQRFGVASNSLRLPVGIMGLGPVFNATFDFREPYALVLDSLAVDNIIASRAYSLALGSASDEAGSLIFGGLDRGKFSGSLKKTPVVKSRDGGTRFTVNLSSIGIDAGNGTHRQYSLKDTNVHLDSGHTFSKLQTGLAEQIFQDLGAELDQDLGFYLVDCKVRDHKGGVTFGFGGDKIITVPFREFVYTAQGLCAVGLEPIKEGEQQVLGDSFLRAAYVVFDWDNEEIHVAQAANCSSEIVSIGRGSGAVPSVVGACRSNTTTSTTGSTASATGFPSSAGNLHVEKLQFAATLATLLLFCLFAA
ncbi:hypothetical protein LCI18_000530 [Fusarium solani-melongenae]|uniref:Uncharacterized protein n=1 Tax=Fusarium solani subsp. cucurbitae TaxID=2747967 RepID=A0ACD3YL13_FUSSC|nr:hypothetical protein LCI18_000530 [Fusarium solani-melongenae]